MTNKTPLRADAALGIPLTPRLSPEWLTAMLRVSGRTDTARVIAVRESAIGNGMMATIDHHEAGAPATLIAKLPSVHEASRQTGIAMGLYRKEVRLYQEIAPALTRGVQQALFADIDDAGADFCLLFDDLAPARMGDQIEGCGLDDAALAIDVAAVLHGAYWGASKIDLLPWIIRDADVDLYQGAYEQSWAQVVERFADRLKPAILWVIEKFAPCIRAYYRQQQRPWTITHQDYRLDNMLFGARRDTASLTVVDWQTVRIGPGMTDVSYFIGACMAPELRRDCERILLQRYVDGLRSWGIRDYGIQQAWSDYRLFAAEGFITAVIAAAMVTPTERGDHMFVALLSRHGQQMLDHQTLSLIH